MVCLLGVSSCIGGGVVVGQRAGERFWNLELFQTEATLVSRYWRPSDSYAETTEMALWMWCQDENLEW